MSPKQPRALVLISILLLVSAPCSSVQVQLTDPPPAAPIPSSTLIPPVVNTSAITSIEPSPVQGQPTAKTATNTSTVTPTRTATPTATKTPLPPLPDFDEVLSFGGGGGGSPVGCEKYPSKPNRVQVYPNFGREADFCFTLTNIDSKAAFQLNLLQLNGGALSLSLGNLTLDRKSKTVLWNKTRNGGRIDQWTKSGTIQFIVRVWWPISLPPGNWRLTISQSGSLLASTDFSIFPQTNQPYINVVGIRSNRELAPIPPFASPFIEHPIDMVPGHLEVFGIGYPSDTLVYVLLYRSNGGSFLLIDKEAWLSDHSGNVIGEFTGSFGVLDNYLLYGVTDPDTVLSIGSASCFQSLAGQPNAACEYFYIKSIETGTSNSCPGAPPQRMTINQRGYACTRSDPVRLRTAPAKSASTLLELYPGAQFTVIGGPSCSDNWSWWNVRLDDGMTGWMAEGGDAVDPYFICPLP